jgi:ubiquinone/menaquinone biosynthesis C-methylase UbiE
MASGRVIFVLAVAACLWTAVTDGFAQRPPASMRMSSMTEADWDANDRQRESRYKLDLALDSVGIEPGMTVGEVGAGAGYVVFKLAARVGAAGKVYAEDIKPYALDMLKVRAARRDLSNIQTVVGAPDDPGLPPGTFDLLFMHATIQFIDKPAAVFRALAPCLKAGGKIIVIEPSRPEYLEAFREAGLRVDRVDGEIVPPHTLYVLSK